MTAAQAQRRGFAIVHQHPALLPDLTVAENMLLAVPRSLRHSGARGTDLGGEPAGARRLRGASEHAHGRGGHRAAPTRSNWRRRWRSTPKVLVLDEPTAPLTADLVELLFEKIRLAAARGAGGDLSSRTELQEVRQIADRVTVMRDGEVRGSAPIAEMSDEEMLRLIVGRHRHQRVSARRAPGRCSRPARWPSSICPAAPSRTSA